MRIRVPMMVEDPLASAAKGMALCEGVELECEDSLLDGPVGSRVAVVDFDPARGTIAPGAQLLRPGAGRVLGEFVLPKWQGGGNPAVVEHPNFIQVNVFSTAMKTLEMFEEPDCLGRRIQWAFGRPQLLLVPRAGEHDNAWYERNACSIQLYYFDDPEGTGRKVYTALSRDIVAHETGHAILDGIAPELYDALLPQSLALHEAVADLTSLLVGLRSGTLRKTILDATSGSIDGANALNWVALQFGRARGGKERPLRDLYNERAMPRPEDPCRTDPYALSLVLSGALYRVLVRQHEAIKAELRRQDPTASEHSVSGKALFMAGEALKRLALRGLDYLPPGEASFADYGRAMLAADRVAFPGPRRERTWIAEELVKRGIVRNPTELGETDGRSTRARDAASGAGFVGMRLDDNLDDLVRSDWAAHRFAESHRDLLGIPAATPVVVKPPVLVTRSRLSTGAASGTWREILFKVSWEEVEKNPATRRVPGLRRVTRGTTLVLDPAAGTVRALLTTGHLGSSRRAVAEAAERTAMLKKLLDADLVRLVEPSGAGRTIGDESEVSRAGIAGRVAGGALRLKGTARLLHVVGWDPVA